MELDEKYPKLVATAERDFGMMNKVWDPLPGDGADHLEVKPWHKNDGGLQE